LQAGCDLVLLCNQSLGDGRAVDDLLDGLADALRTRPLAASPDSAAPPGAVA
jgi:beta-N-acetylhexosaminidase